jgi:hypothetical protein
MLAGQKTSVLAFFFEMIHQIYQFHIFGIQNAMKYAHKLSIFANFIDFC